MRYTIRWRYLLTLTVLLTLMSGAVYGVHRWQVGRQTGAFLHQADLARAAKEAARADGKAAEADEQAKAEAGFLTKYLVAQPKDVDARERLGRLLADRVPRTRDDLRTAYLTMNRALVDDPAREDLRRRLVDYATQYRMLAEAESHLDELLRAHPGDGELLTQAGKVLELGQKYPQAVDRLRAAVKARPDLIEPVTALARLLMRQAQGRSDEADRAVAGLLASRPDDHRVQLEVADYWRASGDQKAKAVDRARPLAEAQRLGADETVGAAASRAVGQARRLAPDDAAVLDAAAKDAFARAFEAAVGGDRAGGEAALADARASAARAVRLHPKAAAAYRTAAVIESYAGQPKAAADLTRQGLAELPGHIDLRVDLLKYQVQAADVAGADATAAELRKVGHPEVDALADLRQAQVLALRDDWEGAAKLLTGLIGRPPASPARPDQPPEVYLLYARCWDQLGEHDKAVAAYKKAQPPAPTDPLWGPAYSGEAAAELARGNTDAAMAAYQKAATGSPAAWAGVAKVELLRALRTPDGQRDWKAAEAALDRADRAAPGAADVALLRVDLRNVQKRPADARQLVDDLRRRHPKDPAVWVAAVNQELIGKDPAAAAKTLEEGKRAAGDSAALRLAEARVLAVGKAPDLGARLLSLAAGADKLGKAQQRALLRGLAEYATAAGEPKAAAALWEEAGRTAGANLDVHLRRFDLAVRADDPDEVARALAAVKAADGGDGGQSYRLAAALVLLVKAQKEIERAPKDARELPDGAKRLLEDARTMLEGLEADRPGWGRASLALADVLMMERKPAAALAKYRKAVSEGVTNPDALRRLTELLIDAGRLADAEEVVRKFPPEYLERPEVQRLVSGALVSDPRQAFDRAQRAIPADSKSHADQLYLGQKAWAAGEKEKAEKAFRAAVGLKPELPGVWLTLARFLAVTGRPAEADKVAAEGAGKVPAAEKTLFEATAAALLGQRDKAAAAFKKAREERPREPRAVKGEADYLFHLGNLGEAAAAYKRVLALADLPADDKAAGVKMLAICLAADRDPETSREALRLLGVADGAGLKAPPAGETADQRSVRILALSLQKDRESRLEAIRLLEERRKALDPPDLFRLYLLYAAVGNQREVPLVLADLNEKTRKEPVPVYLIHHADWLLRNGQPAQADELVRRLAGVQPESLPTAELKARVAMAQKDPKAAQAALLARAGEGANVATLAAVARSCEQVGLTDDAERLFRRSLAAAPPEVRPAAALNLAAFVGRRGRTAEALTLLDGVRAQLPPATVGGVAIGILYATPNATPADAARVVGWLEGSAKAAADPAVKQALTTTLATVKNFQQDYRGSMDLYNRTLAQDPRDVAALNNLAYLVAAVDKKYDAALDLIARAKRAVGPNPEVVDTEAQILLLANRPKEARELLLVAAAEAPAGIKYFHLAQAELALGDKTAARAAWAKAKEIGVKPAELHPLEKPAHDQMAAEFN